MDKEELADALMAANARVVELENDLLRLKRLVEKMQHVPADQRARMFGELLVLVRAMK
jgi:hypothetical protein